MPSTRNPLLLSIVYYMHAKFDKTYQKVEGAKKKKKIKTLLIYKYEYSVFPSHMIMTGWLHSYPWLSSYTFYDHFSL